MSTPTKEGEPLSERIAQIEMVLEMGCYPGADRETPVALSEANYDALRKLLADAKQRAVAQEAEGRRLRDACAPWLEAQLASYFANKLETLPDSYPVASNITLGDLRRLRAALSGSSETPK